jgi:RecA-family ATPase
MSSTLDWANRYYANHFNVIPLRLDKRPRLVSWKKYQNEAVTPADIQNWFGGGLKPPVNVGIVTGKVSGIWVLDADSEEAIHEIERLTIEGLIPKTEMVAATRRGRHYYFSSPLNSEIKSGPQIHAIIPQVDVKGEGGYIIAPPSLFIDGKGRYTWLNDFHPDYRPPVFHPSAIQRPGLDLPPAAKRDHGLSPDPATAPPLGGGRVWWRDSDGQLWFDLTGVKDLVTKFEAAELGRRNVTLTSQVGLLVRRGLRNDEVYSLAKVINMTYRPPMDDSEIDTIVDSVLKAEAARRGLKMDTGEAEDEEAERPFYIDAREAAIKPAPYRWLIRDSFLRNQMGIIFGPPGSGKGLLSIHMLIRLAAGQPIFDHWIPERRFRTMLISAEDNRQVLRHRLYDVVSAMSPDEIEELDFKAFAVKGDVALTEMDKTQAIIPTKRYVEFRRLLEEHRPEVLILDTLSRFIGGDENSNPLMTGACVLLEDLVDEFDCNIILIHHTNKNAGDIVRRKTELAETLTQSSLRGATALAGAVRWALMLNPVSTALASNLTGDKSIDQPDGNYVVAKVVKKNAGPMEAHICLSKTLGQLTRILEIDGKAGQVGDDAGCLAQDIKLREDTAEPPLTVSSVRRVFNWGEKRAAEAVKYGLDNGMFGLVKSGRGHILVSGESIEEEE